MALVSYNDKDKSYFAGARRDWVNELPISRSARLLEVGCGNGDTGAYALAEQKCLSVTGIEIQESAARESERKITKVICGDVEAMSLPFEQEYFDILMLSEVLEHLADPWTVLRKLHSFMRPGGLVFASSPNVSSFSVIKMLVLGDWRLEQTGVMDRTHLRWFTPKTYREMFVECGYSVNSVKPVTQFGHKKEFVSKLTFGKFDHLFMRQIDLRAIRR